VDGKEYTCEDIVIATGSYPARPPIPGLDLPGVVTSNEVLEGESVDYKSLIIIGGGVIGVELASFYAALGCKVTIVEALDRLLSTLDKEFGQSIAMLLKKRGVQVFCSSMVSSIEQTHDGLVCNFTRKEQQEQVVAEGILVSIGRRPNTEGLFAENCTPELNRGFVVVDENYQSTIPHIYAIGDVIGGVQLAHKAEAEGQAVAAIICGEEPHCDPSLVPSCIYTEPEIASVGITADEAKAKGIAVKTGKYLMSGNGKSIIDLQERGFIKVVADAETDRLLGIQMMCGRATDLISESQMAIANGMTRRSSLRGCGPIPPIVKVSRRRWRQWTVCPSTARRRGRGRTHSKPYEIESVRGERSLGLQIIISVLLSKLLIQLLAAEPLSVSAQRFQWKKIGIL
jgi:dihydrolipoamide dehydrogenase